MMKRALSIVAAMFVLSLWAGLVNAQSVDTDGAEPLRLTAAYAGLSAPAPARVQQPGTTAQGKPVPLQSTSLPPRLASMVGYIDDPIVSSKVRVRYELAHGNTVPDRAEFFYAKCGCYRDIPITDPAFDREAPGPRPGAADDIDFRQFFVMGEFAPSRHVSFFAELPVRWVMPQSFIPGTGPGFTDKTGIGDLRAGAKIGLGTAESYAVTAQVKAFLPTGEAAEGLGTDHFSLEPALLYFQQMNRFNLEMQTGVWLPFDGAAGIPVQADEHFAGNVFFYGIGPSVEVVRTDQVRVAPIVELIGWRVLDGFQTMAPALGDADASGTNIVNLKFGARIVWNNRGSVYVGYGKALTDALWYDDILRFEYRQGF
jgi:hypothetical protein